MTDLSRRSLLLGGLLTAASAGAFAAQPRRHVDYLKGASLERLVPESFGPWRHESGGGIVRPPDEEQEKGRYDQEVLRIYFAADEAPVMVVIAYGNTQSDTLQVHRPEFCYPAAGFSLGAPRRVEIAAGARRVPASFFTATRGDRVEHILYWTRLGEYFPVTWLGQHWSRVQNSFDGVLPDGVLVRMSLIGGTPDAALERLKRFATEMVASVAPTGRLALLGRGAA